MQLGVGNDRIDRLARTRFGEQEALHFVTPGDPQQDALLFGFDALGRILKPSALPSATIAWIIAPLLAVRPSGVTKALSIFSLSKAKRCRLLRLG